MTVPTTYRNTTALTRRQAPSTQRPSRRRRALLAAGSLAVTAASVAVGVHLATSNTTASPPDACTVASPDSNRTFSLTAPQAQNASIIAAVAVRQGLADHAVTVALAAALQETGLRNLPYGDRDSVGLFQQRPSQGWGTRAQLLDPIYATTAFYSRLAQLPGWQSLAVTEAAQAVQHSAAPDAYATWEPEARAIAVALTGEAPAGLACRLSRFQGAAPPPAALGQAAAAELGPGMFDRPLDDKTGWRLATWAVAHAWAYHLGSVSFAGRRWTPRSGNWQPTGGATGSTARVTIQPGG